MILLICCRSLSLLRFDAGEQLARPSKVLVAKAVGEQAVVADAHEASGQHVEEEAAQELLCVEGHDALPAAMSMVLPAEGDALTVEASRTGA